MPKAIKKKVTKRTALKETEVKSAVFRLVDSLKEKKNFLIYILLAVCIVAVLTVVLALNLSSQHNDAYALELEAHNSYYAANSGAMQDREKRWKESLELFLKAASIKPTASTRFYIGNCYFNLGDYDNAIASYNQFIDEYGNDEVILPLVYQKLASAYIKKGKKDEAIKTFDSLAGFKQGVFKDTALVLEARYHESAGRLEASTEKYKELVEEFPLSAFASEALAKTKVKENKQDSLNIDDIEEIIPITQDRAEQKTTGY